MELATVWFLLIGILLVGYAVLDGFDLGVGVLHLFAKDEQQRRIHLAAIGPVWDGNEVWLLAGGGALFAAFPVVYATVFSGFYLAFMLLLFALIFRAVSLEFRGHVDSHVWRRIWDWGFGLGSLVPAILFGVAIGNVLRGLPIDRAGTLHICFLALLNPYALLIGLLSLAMFVMHGAVYLAARTEGELQTSMARWTIRAWGVFVILFLLATAAMFEAAPHLLQGYQSPAILLVILVVLLAAAGTIPLAVRSRRFLWAFLASAVTIASLIGLMGLSLYPRIVPSSMDLANSLTIHNASSTPRTLQAMLVIALLGMPVVIGYTAYIYSVVMGKVVSGEDGHY